MNLDESFIGEPPEGNPDEQDEREKAVAGLERACDHIANCINAHLIPAPHSIVRMDEALRQMREDTEKLSNYEFMEVQASQHKARITELERQLAEAKLLLMKCEQFLGPQP